MTDPNRDKPEVVHHTTINNPPARSGGGGGMAFIIGAIVVVLAIVAYVVWSGGAAVPDAADTNVDVNIDVPAPKMPELPAVEPPTIPTPTTSATARPKARLVKLGTTSWTNPGPNQLSTNAFQIRDSGGK